MSERVSCHVAYVNLGCRVNRVETDLIASKLEHAGCRVSSVQDADVVVINTCAVTGEAQTKTRKAIRRACALPQHPKVVATGCVASLFADELRDMAPDIVIEPNKAQVADRVLDELGRDAGLVQDASELACSPTPTGRMRPGIKIQDGCDNRCSFCIVWKARGPSRSLDESSILAAMREACARNAREVVLTGINLGTYRADGSGKLAKGAGLDELLRLLLAKTGVERIRLSSIEPQDVSDGLLRVMQESEGRVAPFLHVCLQSGCDDTLRRMHRTYDTAYFRDVVARARAHVPHIALGTDLMVGFPGETNDEFEQSLAFCREMGFARMHVFRYSRRPGTVAAEAPGQVDAQVAICRSTLMRELARESRAEQMRRLVGTQGMVLVQSAGVGVDGHLYDVKVDAALPVGEHVRVLLYGMEDGRLLGM